MSLVRTTGAIALIVALSLSACNGPVPPVTATANPASPTPATTTRTPGASTPTPASTIPTQATPTPAPATISAATPTPVAATSTPATSTLKIGVVTDVRGADDKSFIQSALEGARKGAADLGASEPEIVLPADPSAYANGIRQLVDQGFNVIVTVGSNLGMDTTRAARENPNLWFIGVDQAICIDEAGAPDTARPPTCQGDPRILLPRYVGLLFQEDQAGYLAGIIAAAISRNHIVGAIGGTNLVPSVVRYIQGYQRGAMATDPSTVVRTGYVSTDNLVTAFADPAAGQSYATQFIQANHTDVLFQVAGGTGIGILQAACNANIFGIGVDVDQWGSLSAATDPTYQCIVTSAEKHLSDAVEQTLQAVAAGTAAGGNVTFNAGNGGIGVSAEQDGKGMITPDIQARLEVALAGMKDGSVATCPATCGQP